MKVGKKGTVDRRPVDVHWRRDIEELFGDAHMDKVMGKGKAQMGKMDVSLRDSNLDTQIKICTLVNVIVLRLKYAGKVREGNAKLVKQMETALKREAKKILGCSEIDKWYGREGRIGKAPTLKK